MNGIFWTKSIRTMNIKAHSSELQRVLTPWDLICLGIGIIIGTGVFVFTGIGAADYAGPGLMLSFVFSGLACAFAGMAYAELAAVILGLLYAQIRLFLAMARDGLLPQSIGTVPPRYKTPHRLTLVTGVIVAAIVGFVRIEILAEMVNIGTLFAFITASTGVFVLRLTKPSIARPFRCPAAYLVMPLAVITCGYLMISLSAITWKFFAIWTVIGCIVYAGFSYRNSIAGKQQKNPAETTS